ncbi:hypothetical protein BYT27DRAFT_6785787 [Phlegmacium glaucopus]|nr:hypothetical protein BYT27DRAFT_6785787 [Phlegmacium glaucopus]
MSFVIQCRKRPTLVRKVHPPNVNQTFKLQADCPECRQQATLWQSRMDLTREKSNFPKDPQLKAGASASIWHAQHPSSSLSTPKES